ncbi:MAG: glutaredoxin family protein [Verrucomicrobiota bacterium]
MSDQPHFKLYLKPGCPWCTRAKAWLDEHGYRYQELDVIADDNAFTEMQELTSQTLAPSLVVNHKEENQLILPDFGPDELADFLDEHQIPPHGDN